VLGFASILPSCTCHSGPERCKSHCNTPPACRGGPTERDGVLRPHTGRLSDNKPIRHQLELAGFRMRLASDGRMPLPIPQPPLRTVALQESLQHAADLPRQSDRTRWSTAATHGPAERQQANTTSTGTCGISHALSQQWTDAPAHSAAAAQDRSVARVTTTRRRPAEAVRRNKMEYCRHTRAR
jgi:hypothetical protein